MKKIDKNFVSDIDKRFAEFNAVNPRSKEQLAEFNKYQRIYQLRDGKGK